MVDIESKRLSIGMDLKKKFNLCIIKHCKKPPFALELSDRNATHLIAQSAETIIAFLLL